MAVQFGGTGSAEHKRLTFKVKTSGTNKFARQRSQGQRAPMQALNEEDENSKLEEDEDEDEQDQVDRARKNFRQLHDSDGD